MRLMHLRIVLVAFCLFLCLVWAESRSGPLQIDDIEWYTRCTQNVSVVLPAESGYPYPIVVGSCELQTVSLSFSTSFTFAVQGGDLTFAGASSIVMNSTCHTSSDGCSLSFNVSGGSMMFLNSTFVHRWVVVASVVTLACLKGVCPCSSQSLHHSACQLFLFGTASHTGRKCNCGSNFTRGRWWGRYRLCERSGAVIRLASTFLPYSLHSYHRGRIFLHALTRI